MPERHIGNVHRAALAGAVAGGRTGDLGHHAVRVGPARHEYGMAAMMGGEGIAWLHGEATPTAGPSSPIER